MSYDIDRYLNVRSAHGASVGPSGDRVAFLMNTTGVPQIWTLDAPRAWPEQRSFFEERVTFVDWSPERDELLFGMDEGGNERAQLFLLDAETGVIENLTDHPSAKHRWGGWSGDGERFAFASNRRDPAVFDVYVQHRDERGDEATLIAEGDGWLSLAGWSPDDDRLLVHEARSSFDHDLHVLELDSGDRARLTPDTDDDDVRYASPSWSPDGDAVYCCTDVDSDTAALARIDVGTGAIDTVRDGDGWDVGGVAIHEDTGRLVYSRNVDGYTDLTVGELVGETTIEERPAPNLPGTIAGGVDFTPDGERFVITATGRTMNANVFFVDFETGDTDRWTDAPTAGIPRETFRKPELVRYESVGVDGEVPETVSLGPSDGLEVPAFFTLPENPVEGETPVIVDVHGGPESQRRPSFSAVQQYFLDRGYAIFEPNVRGSTGYGRAYTHLDDVERRMDSVADLNAGAEWLSDHPAIDPDRIAVKGGSYGGFMVLAAMTEYPERWAAGVDVVGIANFVTFLENTGDWRRELREAEYGSLETDREFLESISPINTIDRIEAPLFVLHGENDPRVPVGEARQVAERAEEAGVPVRTLYFEDEGHGFTKLENRIEAYSAIAEFLDEHV